MCKICGISEQRLPALHESYEAVGTLFPFSHSETVSYETASFSPNCD